MKSSLASSSISSILRSGRAKSVLLGGVVLLFFFAWRLGWRQPEKKKSSDGASSRNALAMRANQMRWRRELQQQGHGDWATWNRQLIAFQADVRRQLKARPEINGLVARDGFLFYRDDVNLLLSGDLRLQKKRRDPYPAIVHYNQQLRASGVDLLLVIIPSKSEIFPEKLSAIPLGERPIVAPYVRKFMMELDQAGVECVDLLPTFLEERKKHPEPFYMKQDTHWSNIAVRAAARLIGERVKRYSWFPEAAANPVGYTTRKALIKENGDVVGMLPGTEKTPYQPQAIFIEQVLLPDGSPYEDAPNSPIALLGDSFCGAYGDRHAGLAAHLAREIGMPVCAIATNGGGVNTARRTLGAPWALAVSRRKLIVWTMAGRCLYRSVQPWAKVAVP